MIYNDLDRLKYEIYKKSWKKDYLTFNQFKNNENVAYTFSELQKQKSKKVLKNKKK